MNLKGDLIIGVELRITTIKICYLNNKGYFLDNDELNSPHPLTPGSMVVELCEHLEIQNKTRALKSLGVSLPASIDCQSRIVKKSNSLEGWLDVPLADWLETRLTTPVILGNTKKCEFLGRKFRSTSVCSSNGSVAAMGMARLAYSRFLSNVSTFKAG